ncbi:Hypothetical membrane protein OS=Gracilibacillus boraciitolerans JCM 21714 GN=JCM21714_4748 PE=4 SV=1: DUF4282 [Gemmata massiliana]|uniref:Uncharacterized protein n=1 Tax=Gemmata massiliana TaxID=1210884 RepID=A0A6P2CUQ4_9BACT|nr:DUF4282 domain-containing protein [Gemmata massiliana]VTR92709.1 Hypothetical membrane protein OS=Gracilibacillus boraciitolerans JCM 21714 GN=JCM21714_4748 PE=4 SV=1: DUF4282 [Gemmata massiliana]
MPVVPCPHCSKPVSLPPDWTGTAYTCPHCRRVVSTSEPPEPPPPPARPPRSSASRQSVSPPPPPLPLPPPPIPAREPREQEEPFDIDPTPRRRRRLSTNPIIDFVTFRLMITPILIQIVFWFGTLSCIVSGLKVITESFQSSDSYTTPFDDRSLRAPGGIDRPKMKEEPKRTFSFQTFALGVVIIFVGPLIVRLYCEIFIIIFKIHDELKLSNDRQRYRL